MNVIFVIINSSMKKVLDCLLLILTTWCLIGLNEYTLVEAKIDYELNQRNMTLTSDELSESISTFDEVSVVVRLNYGGFEYENNLKDDATMEEVDKFKEAKREYGRKYHSEKNKKVYSTFSVSNYKNVFVSEYMPFIEFNFDQDEFNNSKDDTLKKLSSHKDISKVIIREGKTNYKEQIYNALNIANARSYYNDDDHTGAGIKVGIIEPGVIDATHENLLNSNVTIYNQVYYDEPVTDHATIMASIIGGEYGLAPDVDFYSSAIHGNILHEAEWMINRGVDIINLSFSEANPNGEYDSNSSYIDYLVAEYDVMAVAAIGNSGQSAFIGNPALGYNVLSVGAHGNSGVPWVGNSRRTLGTRAKPTILAPGVGVTIRNYDECFIGTSVSCAFTTGCIALFLEANPVYKTKPMQVIAMICAGALRVDGYTENTAGNGFNKVAGAGRLNLGKTFDTIYKTTSIHNVNSTENQYRYNFDVYMSQGVNLRSVFAWAATVDFTSNSVNFTSYDSIIFKYDGTIAAIGGSIFDNICFAQCIVPNEGTYDMKLFQDSELYGSSDDIYFAYRYR